MLLTAERQPGLPPFRFPLNQFRFSVPDQHFLIQSAPKLVTAALRDERYALEQSSINRVAGNDGKT